MTSNFEVAFHNLILANREKVGADLRQIATRLDQRIYIQSVEGLKLYVKRQSRMLSVQLPLGAQFESCTVIINGIRYTYTAGGLWRPLEEGYQWVWGQVRVVENEPGRPRVRYPAVPLQLLRHDGAPLDQESSESSSEDEDQQDDNGINFYPGHPLYRFL